MIIKLSRRLATRLLQSKSGCEIRVEDLKGRVFGYRTVQQLYEIYPNAEIWYKGQYWQIAEKGEQDDQSYYSI